MTNKTTMPEPYWYEVISEDGLKVEMYKTDEAAIDAALDMGGVVEINHLITTDQSEAYADARVEKVLGELRKLSDGAYCRYIDTLYRDECLGWEAKVKDGRFGEREFNAHKKAHEFLGQHRAFAEAIITICALIPTDNTIKEQQK